MAAKKRCEICDIRPIGGGVGSGYEDEEHCRNAKICLPCGDEGQMDIAHLNGHEGISEEECWYCHPELNKASADYQAKAGTSRVGVQVIAKGGPEDKANIVKTAIEAQGGTATVKTNKSGITTLAGTVKDQTVTLKWDRGAYHYGPSVIGGKKVRNVAEAIRIING